ncbi:MAG: exo-alpha-sialidase [Planctomycetaceae bacterium]
MRFFAVNISVLLLCVLNDARLYSQENTPRAEPEHTLLFDSGRNGYPRYRIPALAVTPSGTLLAICEGRKDGRGLTGNIDIVSRRSQDGGKTWSPVEIVADDGDDTLGNPCIVQDASTKIVWLAYTRSLGSDTEESITDGTSRERTHVFVTSSHNDGEDWTKPIDITATTKQPDWTWYGTGPGVGIQMKNGRLVIPSYHAEEKTSVYRSHMIYSDDHGQSWKHGQPVGEHCGECHVVETGDGHLVLNSRTNMGKELRTTANSSNGGETWSLARFDERLYDSHCQASLIALPGTKDHPSRWLFTHPAGPGRRKLTARVSFDEGQTWPIARLLREGDSQYSCTAVLPDGSIGCLYDCWNDGNYRLFFVRFDQEWIVN